WMDDLAELKKAQQAEEAAGQPIERIPDWQWAEGKRAAQRWIDVFEKVALESIDRNPQLLDDNLRYHWCHFLTQRSLWMRDWCLQEDPLAFERRPRGISAGGPVVAHNDRFLCIVEKVVGGDSSNCSPGRARALFLMLGTRRERLDHGRLMAVLGQFEKWRSEDAGERTEHLLHGIFELSRQGFLEPGFFQAGAGRDEAHERDF